LTDKVVLSPQLFFHNKIEKNTFLAISIVACISDLPTTLQQGNYALARNNVDNLALKSDPLQLWQSYDSNGKIEDLEPIAAIMDRTTDLAI